MHLGLIVELFPPVVMRTILGIILVYVIIKVSVLGDILVSVIFIPLVPIFS